MRLQSMLVLYGIVLIGLVSCAPTATPDKETRMATLRVTPPPTLGALVEVTFPPTPTPTATPTPLPSPTPTPTLLPYALTVKKQVAAFIAEDELWIANLDGSGERRLLKWPATDFAWAPDGQSLAAIRHGSLWLVFPFSEEAPIRLAPLTGLSVPKPMISWSPDGRWIIARDNWGLWAVSLESYAVQVLQKYRYTQSVLYEWASDGSHLIIREEPASGTPETDLTWRVIDIETGESTAFDQLPAQWADTTEWAAEEIRQAALRVSIVDAATGAVAVSSSQSFSSMCHGPMAWTYESPHGAWQAVAVAGNGRYGHLSVCVKNSAEAFYLRVDGHSSRPVWDVTGRYVYLVAANINPDQPDLDPQTRLMRFDTATRRLEQMALLDQTWGELGALGLSPDGRYLSHLTPHQLEIIDTQDWTTVVQPLELYALDASRGEYAWSADSRYLAFRMDIDARADERGSRLYAYSVSARELRRISNARTISSWSINPALATD